MERIDLSATVVWTYEHITKSVKAIAYECDITESIVDAILKRNIASYSPRRYAPISRDRRVRV